MAFLWCRDAVRFPPRLAERIECWAAAAGTTPAAIVGECVTAFARRSADIRWSIVNDFWLDASDTRRWTVYYLDKPTLAAAKLARVGGKSRDQVIVAAVAWKLIQCA